MLDGCDGHVQGGWVGGVENVLKTVVVFQYNVAALGVKGG